MLAKHLQATLPPTQAPKTGDRIDYVIKPGCGKVFQRAVHPDDVRSGKEEPDVQWYLNNLEWCRRVQDGSYQRERLGALENA